MVLAVLGLLIYGDVSRYCRTKNQKGCAIMYNHDEPEPLEASLKTADRVARERSRLIREIEYDLELLTLYELKSEQRRLKERYHL